MVVLKVIQSRRSIRSYDSHDVEEDKLLRVLESGRLSPSAGNRQERRFIVIKDTNTRKLLSEAANNQRFVAEAPVVIVACSVEKEYIMKCGQLAYPIDTAIADIRVVALLPLGYPSTIPQPIPRKSLDEIVIWEKWRA